MRYCSRQLTEIRVDNCLEAPAVCQIIDYMYTARCRLNYFNFYPVFQAATYLRMPTIIHAAQRLMTHLMADENLAIMLEVTKRTLAKILSAHQIISGSNL